MVFNSITFAVFFLLSMAMYRLLSGSHRRQNMMLLVMSYVFYGWWDYRFLYLIALSTCIDFSTARIIDIGRMTVRERAVVAMGMISSAFFLVTVQWGAIAVYNQGLRIRAEVDWASLLPMTWQNWGVFIGTLGLTVLLLVLHGPGSRLTEVRRRRVFLWVSMVSNLAILGFFKYFNFFQDSFVQLSESIFGVSPDVWTLHIILPVGISFYTFQTMSYTIDVYRRDMRSCASLLDFATYVTFFPQLVAGPIERGAHLLPQFERARVATREDWRSGCWLIAWGLYKKVVVADNMALIVNQVFGPYDSMTASGLPADGLVCLVAVYAFAFQIYADFSGYSDIARGTAKLMGFDLMLNFRLPYFATSPSAFWQRWHISLSTWLRDYLYIPLGGNKHGTGRTYVNLMLTMLLGGLWHGAAWTFVIWGAYQGALLVVYRMAGIRTENRQQPFWKSLVQGIIMFQFVCVGWLIFRSQNVYTIGVFLQSIFLNSHGSPEALQLFCDLLFYGWFLVAYQIVQARTGDLEPVLRWHWFARLNVWWFILFSILTLRSRVPVEFIYFAF